MEVLEDRIALATFFVVNSLDGPGSGPAGSLRSAITQATQPGSGTNRVVITPGVTRPIDLTAGEIQLRHKPRDREPRGPRGRRSVRRSPASGSSRSSPVATEVTISGRNRRTPITIEGGSLTDADANGGGILVAGDHGPDAPRSSTSPRTPCRTGTEAGSTAQAGTITLVGSSVTQNLAPDGFGGGIYVLKGTVIARDGSHVDENSALNIGGIGVNAGPGVFEDAVRLLAGARPAETAPRPRSTRRRAISAGAGSPSRGRAVCSSPAARSATTTRRDVQRRHPRHPRQREGDRRQPDQPEREPGPRRRDRGQLPGLGDRDRAEPGQPEHRGGPGRRDRQLRHRRPRRSRSNAAAR